MRHQPRPSLSVLFLLLALAVPSLFFIEAAHTKSAASPEAVPHAAEARNVPASPSSSEPESAAATRVMRNYGQLPLSFESDGGRGGAGARFLARNGAYSVRLSADEIALALRGATGQAASGESRASVLRIKLLGASARARAYGLDEQEGKINYLVGRDPARWRTNVPNYGRVKYEGVYPGVDVIYYGTQRQLEYDFAVAPGADAGRISLRVEGARGIRVDADGDLVLPTTAGEVRQRAPHAYQEVGGVRRTVSCRYVLRGAGRVGFELGAYDRGLPVVIDPIVSYSTYLGGGAYDEGSSVAVDAQGNAYVTGFASSWDFPVTPNAPQSQRGGGAPHRQTYDAFVTKLNADGTALVYSTYLGGFEDDFSTSIAVDGAGQAHVAGWTNSADFPTTPGAYRTTAAGGQDVFVSKLNADGSALLYSTYLGGSGNEYGAHLALGGGGEIYVGGMTPSQDFPVTPGSFRTQPGSAESNVQDGFVAKLSAEPGAGLIFSTYLGGSAPDFVEGLAVAAGLDDSVYVTGRTISNDFPTTPNALQTALAGGGSGYDAFVTRLNSAGTAAVFSTYLGGGNDYDGGTSVAVGPGGTAYVTGYTYSHDFPTTPGVYKTVNNGGADAFVARLSADGTAFNYSTFFGGSNSERSNAVAVDAQGNAYVAGETDSYDLPVTPGAPRQNFGGGFFDGFFFKLSPEGRAVSHATYIGGDNWDAPRGVAVGAGGEVYLTGVTASTDFYTTPGAFTTADPDAGQSDGFVMRINLDVADSYTVGGRVTNFAGSGLSSAEVTVYSPFTRTVVTDADGYYTINGIPPGSEVRLYATRFGVTLYPVEAVIPNIHRDETINFVGRVPLVISGHVVNELGYGRMVPITLTGSASQATYTNYDGYYAFVVEEGGSYTVTPGPDSEFTFEPATRSVSNMTADQTFDFIAQYPPRIMGQVVHNEYNYGLDGILVTLTGPTLDQPVVRTTDDWGHFTFDGLERGASYTVTPTDPETNRSFSPAEQKVTDLQGIPFLSFRALQPLAISGYIKDPNGNPVTGVATLTGTVNAERQVDQWGHFDFFNLPRGGTYTVTVTKPGSLYTFAPPSRSVADLQDFQFFEFNALPPLRIRGRVSERGYYGYDGLRATLTLGGTVSATTQADEWGFYEFAELPRGGDYTVTASYPLYTFAPPSHAVSGAQEDQFFEFNALPPLRIDGTLFDGNGGGVAGATVTLTGAVNATTVTDEYGNYRFGELPRGGSFTVTPAHELYTFAPQSHSLTDINANQLAVFYGSLRRFTLSGRANGPGGSALSGVTMTIGGGYNATTLTDAAGNYSFADLAVGRNYTVEAARPGYSFAPPVFNVNDPRGDQSANFTGSRLAYTVSGRVTDAANGAGLAGATVSLGGAHTATTETDAQGGYTFTGLPSEGDYTVTTTHPNFSFAPATRSFTNLLHDMEADFAATRLKHQIGGRVTDGAGATLAGVTVTLGGATAATTVTDATGLYLFADLPSGFNYTLTAAKTHYTFSPSSRQLDGLGADATADFTATLLTHTISGRVVDVNGNGFAGATVQLIGPRTGVVTTDATGNYSFTSLPAGDSYTVQPSRQFYDFSPTRASYLDLGGDQTANFTATLRTFSVGGRVTEGANGVAGVTINLGGSRTATTQTDAAGNYLFTALPADGNYTVTPAHPYFSFSPGGTTINTLPFNQTANFAASRLLYQVGGYTLDPCGRAVPGVTMSLTHDGLTTTAQTNASGLYSFAGVQAGYGYTLAPTGSTHTFNPSSVFFPGLNANQSTNFTGTPPISTADVSALADLYVRGGTSAGTNFGNTTQLITRLASQTSNTYETYVKFDAGQRCTVSAVKLRLYGQLSSSGTLTVAVYAVPSTTWTETGTTWNNKPAAGTLLRTVNMSGTTARWYEWDVTDYVRTELNAGRSVVSFVLKSTSSTNYQATFTSRQATGTNAPRLTVTTP